MELTGTRLPIAARPAAFARPSRLVFEGASREQTFDTGVIVARQDRRFMARACKDRNVKDV
eukprot:522630-Lingulodinium_polyedra.AAC.1